MKEDIHRIISISRSVSQTVYTRKNTVWTREKITQLIELYKKHDCLWNHWNDSYKNKEKRNRAIEEICSILSISKFDFGKKIHNLRNQFNSEMKKLEQRLEAGGGVGYVSEISSSSRSENGDTNSDDNKPILRCKWSHFESLMFLKDVIEPRPGGYQSTFHSSKVSSGHQYTLPQLTFYFITEFTYKIGLQQRTGGFGSKFKFKSSK